MSNMLPRELRRALLHRRIRHGNNAWIRRQSRFAYPEGMKAHDDDYTDKPEYPAINPELRHMHDTYKRKLKQDQDWKASIRDSETVEEKLIMLNIKRRYGWRATELGEKDFGYNCTPYYSFITRTHLVPEYQLPVAYWDAELCKKATHVAEKVKEPLRDLIRFELDGIQRGFKEDLGLWPDEIELVETTSIVNQINRLLLSVCSEEAPHLLTCQVDYQPKLEAFWSCGGLEAPEKEVRRRERIIKTLQEGVPFKKNDPVERNFQYLGSPILQIRSSDPIRYFAEPKADLCIRGDSIPDKMRYKESNYGLRTNMRFATVLNGHWLGDDHRSSLLSIHPQNHLQKQHKQTQHWLDDASSALDSQAMLACFSRMLAQAYNHGYDQFAELDYPLSTQFISTNGINWSFYAYQLNTIQLDSRNLPKNNLQNIMWGTKPARILNENNELDQNVVETLVKFYLNPPKPISTSKSTITPYVHDTLEKMSDERKREFIFENLRDMYMHKNIMPERHPFPEIYDWEKIYKIYFNTMPLEPRRRWFELPHGFPTSDPYNEPYKLRDPQNVPRALTRYRRLLKEKHEQDRIEAARKAEKERFERGFDPSEEPKQE